MQKIIIPTAVLLLIIIPSAFAERHKAAPALVSVSTCQETICSVPATTSASLVNMSWSNQFKGFFSSLFDTSQWPERWNCGVWTPLHGWIYIISDFSIWLSYFAIPLILGYFVYKKKAQNIPFRIVVILFITFILACGLTHLMDAAIFWWPAYKLSALLRFVTALISIGTVFTLVRVMPGVLELKSPLFLENLVNARTKALVDANEQLNVEIAERKRISDNMRTINQELSTFSYSVSHDLRAPLRSIHGFSQALLEDYATKLDEEGNEYLTRICRASSRMGELIDDMLKLSKISRDEMAFEEIDLSTMVKDVVAMHLQQHPDTPTAFEIETNVKVNADNKLLKIAIENLIDNAIKYSSKHKTPVVKFGYDTAMNAFFIRDNGVGFNMEFADKLFGAFQRLHAEEFDGSGIGLATVKRIILKHGGSIWVDAQENNGATFYFKI